MAGYLNLLRRISAPCERLACSLLHAEVASCSSSSVTHFPLPSSPVATWRMQQACSSNQQHQNWQSGVAAWKQGSSLLPGFSNSWLEAGQVAGFSGHRSMSSRSKEDDEQQSQVSPREKVPNFYVGLDNLRDNPGSRKKVSWC
jgi:hypothetical protein